MGKQVPGQSTLPGPDSRDGGGGEPDRKKNVPGKTLPALSGL